MVSSQVMWRVLKVEKKIQYKNICDSGSVRSELHSGPRLFDPINGSFR